MKYFISLDRRLLEHFNWPLLLTMLALGCCGLINLYSISAHVPSSGWSWFAKQSLFLGAGLAGLAVLFLIDYQKLQNMAPHLYGLSLAMLLAVLLVGSSAGGAQRWLNLGFIRFQPSELIKLMLVIVLAAYLAKREYAQGLGFKELLAPVTIILIPFAMILKQPDLGTALHLALTCVPMVLILRLKPSVALAGLGIVAVGAILALSGYWQVLVEKDVIQPYHIKRIETFLEPEKDRSGAGFQIIQSKNAVGGGQLFGRGFMNGPQQKNGFLPAPETDFAFAALSEEWGFVGAMTVVGLFICLLAAGLGVARRSRDRFGALLALGLTSLLFWQVFINICMVTGLLPVVGIPLPLISYGGTSMVVTIMCVGLILNVSMRRYMFQDDPVRQNPEVWRHPEEEPKAPATVPVRRLEVPAPEEPELHPLYRLPHRRPWAKYLPTNRHGSVFLNPDKSRTGLPGRRHGGRGHSDE